MGSKGGKGVCGMHWEIGIDTYTLCVLSHFSHVQLFVILWTVACQGPMSTGCSRQVLLQEIFLDWGSKPSPLQLLHCRQLLYC